MMLVWLPVNVTDFGAAMTVVKDVVEDVGGSTCLPPGRTISNALWAFPDHLLGILDGRSKEMSRDSLKKRGSESDVPLHSG